MTADAAHQRDASATTVIVPPSVDDLPRNCRVAIIMDGNGRWAAERNLPVTEGHRAGADALHRTVEAAQDLHVAELTVYAFSTENWSRSAAEITGIMALFCEQIDRETPDLHKRGVRMCFPGRRDRVPAAVVERMEWAEQLTAENQSMVLAIAFDYGGRGEIVEAAQRVVRSGGVDALTEAAISDALYVPWLGDPDLIIRTAGERRSSNFLLWQSAYSEYVYMDVLWPEFGHEPLRYALAEYAGRSRTFGGRKQ